MWRVASLRNDVSTNPAKCMENKARCTYKRSTHEVAIALRKGGLRLEKRCSDIEF
jgi:hypothetical protein